MRGQLADEIERFSRLQLFAKALTAGLDGAEIMEIVVRQGIAGVDAEGGVLALLDSDVVVPVVTVGYAKDRIQAFGPLSLHDDLPLSSAAREGLPVFVASRDEVADRFPAMASKPALSQAWAAIPLVANNQTIGVLGLSFASTHEFDEHERLFLCSLADMTALALSSGLPRNDLVAGPSDQTDDRPADVALIQRVLIYLFEVSLRVVSVSSDPRMHDDLKDKLHALVAGLDAFGTECRRNLFVTDYSPAPDIRGTSRREAPAPDARSGAWRQGQLTPDY